MLDELLRNWIINEETLNSHFSVFIDPNARSHAHLPSYAVARSTILMRCKLQRTWQYPYHSRYMPYTQPYQPQVAFINEDGIELMHGHYIGHRKGTIIYAHEPEFFTKLKDVMYLMHKVCYGKSCSLKRTDFDLVGYKI